LQDLQKFGNKRLSLFGEDINKKWSGVVSDSIYNTLVGTITLNEVEYSQMANRLYQIGDNLGAKLKFLNMNEVAGKAQNLYRFLVQRNAQLSVNICSHGTPWIIDTLFLGLARQVFDPCSPSWMTMPDGKEGILFTNVAAKAVGTANRLTLLLDIPLISQDYDGYSAMVACTRLLALYLSGSLVDDDNQPLSELHFIDISTQVNSFYCEINNDKIPAGSTRVLRLFN